MATGFFGGVIEGMDAAERFQLFRQKMAQAELEKEGLTIAGKANFEAKPVDIGLGGPQQQAPQPGGPPPGFPPGGSPMPQGAQAPTSQFNSGVTGLSAQSGQTGSDFAHAQVQGGVVRDPTSNYNGQTAAQMGVQPGVQSAATALGGTPLPGAAQGVRGSLLGQAGAQAPSTPQQAGLGIGSAAGRVQQPGAQASEGAGAAAQAVGGGQGGFDWQDYLQRTNRIENPTHVQQPGGKYQGDYQFDEATWRANAPKGYEDPKWRNDPKVAAQATLNLADKNRAYAKQQLGRDLTGAETYLLHQQGPGGVKLLLHPDVPAYQLTSAKNIAANGGDPYAPAAQFVKKFTDKFNAPMDNMHTFIGNVAASGQLAGKPGPSGVTGGDPNMPGPPIAGLSQMPGGGFSWRQLIQRINETSPDASPAAKMQALIASIPVMNAQSLDEFRRVQAQYKDRMAGTHEDNAETRRMDVERKGTQGDRRLDQGDERLGIQAGESARKTSQGDRRLDQGDTRLAQQKQIAANHEKGIQQRFEGREARLKEAMKNAKNVHEMDALLKQARALADEHHKATLEISTAEGITDPDVRESIRKGAMATRTATQKNLDEAEKRIEAMRKSPTAAGSGQTGGYGGKTPPVPGDEKPPVEGAYKQGGKWYVKNPDGTTDMLRPKAQ